ncbi:DNA-3-methyladenine glycosylase I [Moellerella wisconsensis]|uniref:DNA-3-methyladenine glycosylase I n=1 Tax=Moellerella wisconsensis ATCC 35017 TaxID=1354267 RepID=A0A0N0ZBD9_9GAMM|nr:DNA-3-methyladenine glycosylase I [Moellerella wisconsensis]KPD03856.1 3-methyladenine DNA glycosylase [Moellerella wisconsensis ATCC 35017]VFS50262.1 DNA-3-methyladenine glycosylase 1 [Moellerella wisconsensis]
MKIDNTPHRCDWVNDDPLYLSYHDHEWGKAIYDNQKLFELICLEGQQAGLSWYTVLKKRENYRELFFQFDPEKIAAMNSQHIENLIQDPRIIRHRGKIAAIISNAQAYLRMREQGEDFSTFIWQFVNHQPIDNHWTELSAVPASTPQSDALANALKKHGFKFIGTTTCYAFMQATGMVNDHLINCPAK